jgi:hypothetical protein
VAQFVCRSLVLPTRRLTMHHCLPFFQFGDWNWLGNDFSKHHGLFFSLETGIGWVTTFLSTTAVSSRLHGMNIEFDL